MGRGWERAYSAEVTLSATPDAVWAVLVDLARYPEWNPFTVDVQSTLKVGDPVIMRVRLGWFTITQVERIAVVDAPHRLAWEIASPVPWLLRAYREQTITPISGGTVYRTVDTIGGLLEPVVGLLFGRALHRGFRGVAEGLAAHLRARG